MVKLIKHFFVNVGMSVSQAMTKHSTLSSVSRIYIYRSNANTNAGHKASAQ